ncbi:MAG: hypothetical protein HQL15_10810, partial [Candidatus Omnitrophica bacterium]|nr:hypothetical protein [Candidatus Omnitrophota bacterium]
MNSSDTSRDCCNGTCADLHTTENCLYCGDKCLSGYICCKDGCQNPQGDTNCKYCGNTCRNGQKCSYGQCVGGCIKDSDCKTPGGYTDTTSACCNGKCKDLFDTDPNNCGGCDIRCTTGSTCCPHVGFGGFGSSCIDTTSDAWNCGSCGHKCDISMETCVSGICVKKCSSSNCSGSSRCCKTGNGSEKACVDPQSEPKNCGDCGIKCGTQSCCFGQCVDLNTTDNCSKCGNSCGEGQFCCSWGCQDNNFKNCGACGRSCSVGQICCYGSRLDGYDDNNCGGCGIVCPTGTTCEGFRCVPNARCGDKTCNSGETCCDNVCTNTQNSDSNCGSCGNVCPTNTHCELGQDNIPRCMCGAYFCSSGQSCCGDSPKQTCADTNSDVHNCGKCGNDCGEDASCINGICVYNGY